MPLTLEERIKRIERRTQPIIPYGPVMTSVNEFDNIVSQQRKGNFELIKVVTAWGPPEGWNTVIIDKLMHQFKFVIVRTGAGDPSSVQSNPLPHYDDVIREIIAWINAMHENVTVWFEIGNEPNIRHDNKYFWDYRYELDITIKRLRTRYPGFIFIAPGVSVNPDHRQQAIDYTSIVDNVCNTQLPWFDYQAIHAYEATTFTVPNTRELQVAMGLYPTTTKFVLSEFGLNDMKMSMQAKEDDLRELCNSKIYDRVFAASYYHLAMKAKDEEQKRYHIYV